MSEPKKVFQQTRQHIKTGNLSFLTKQVTEWQKLTKLIQPLLPPNGEWQVVCYQYGILTITGENQALISQLGYLQKQYISQLSQIHELKDLQKLQLRLRTKPQNKPKTANIPKQLSPATQEMLQSAAAFVNDPKLSQALARLARDKK
ncbi:DUF721 domain-containing protein [Acinetobacter shaoyimingii]|uniref:DUF721 domain-containing protein n=1 Tax=Acinetobacter shaoyimingii TaxID=2715164 RepID=A0A6G8RRR8_9GAMM|nr:DUF721 domain-containing protein [Acinetobacter shaoyimingii]NHB56874.1 DUF721 domain-containing protein [Acinetobacter shaoyimingii]QIO04616.1 DUF721 domain-containing protein [Acinetobacter shaoyimingii]